MRSLDNPVIGKLVAEPCARPPKSGLYGASRTAHDISDLLLRQSLQIEEHDRARVLGQAHQRSLDLLAHDCSEAMQLGIAAEPLTLDRILVNRVHGIETTNCWSATLPTRYVDANMWVARPVLTTFSLTALPAFRVTWAG